MMEVVDENVFPFLRSRNARQIPMEDPREDSPDAEPADGQAWCWSKASFVELWLLRLIVV
jgi:hypothetical protein